MKIHSLTAILLILIGNTISGLGLYAIARGKLGKIQGVSIWAQACLLQSVGWLLVGPLLMSISIAILRIFAKDSEERRLRGERHL